MTKMKTRENLSSMLQNPTYLLTFNRFDERKLIYLPTVGISCSSRWLEKKPLLPTVNASKCKLNYKMKR